MSSREARRAEARASARRGAPSRPSRSTRWLPAALAAAAVLSAVLLALAGWRTLEDRDWHAAVTIDGHATGRADARGRLAVLEALDATRAAVASGLVQAGLMTDAERTASLGSRITGDGAQAVADSLLRDVTVAQEASALGVSADTVGSPDDVLAAEAYAPFLRRIRWLEITAPLASPDPAAPESGWPRAPGGAATDAPVLAARDAVAAMAAREVATTPAADLVARARGAGWDAVAGEAWLPAQGPAAGVPPVLVDALRSGALSVGGTVGPVEDSADAAVGAGAVVADGPAVDASVVAHAATGIRVDPAALRAWADGVALDEALRAHQDAAWASTPSEQVVARELVVGRSDLVGAPGPFAGLAHLVVGELPPADIPPEGGAVPTPWADPAGTPPPPTPWPTASGETPAPSAAGHAVPPSPGPPSPGAALAAELNALPPPERLARWGALVADANAAVAAGDTTHRSGEMGWQSQETLTAEAADAVLRPLSPGTVVGPVATSAGEELLLVRGQYLGALDDHASAVLVQVSTAGSGADLARIAASNAPGAEAALWDPGVALSGLELVGDDPAGRALLGTPVGGRGDPFELDGRILVAVPLARSATVPSGEALARVRVVAYDRWLAWRMTTHSVVVDPDPFAVGSAATATPAASIPAAPPAPAPPSVGLPGLPLPSGAPPAG